MSESAATKAGTVLLVLSVVSLVANMVSGTTLFIAGTPQPPTWLFVWLFATVGAAVAAAAAFAVGAWREQRRSNGMGWGGPR